ncbi:Vegetative incompatibility protein HET-E-1 [Colletotrichum sp. SAR 10_70]|nr:Vegetative incompatibility protein HET-E-1 [Colletotrichum sp. SAR 10_71]KAI8156407.1 Vegetative incompatibility protein HET-E-1 [Colletotrichum sp. SAR 10_65]KAI8193746.1 Vegetative incompatibility protein HET-E-1 [Colletotrichum sp. SAR 10_70]KAJ4995971.1 Vegetative incompatibility protein HET-E-1 [Colletotrichum sp. SAR 10_66]
MDWSFLSRSKSQSGKSTTSTEKPDYGLHTIVPRHSAALEGTDIVAIHGLNGHYLKTWTDEKTGTNWLKSFVPQIVPVARVMSFWYNSTVQFSKSTSDIDVFSDQLLEGLLAERESIEEQDRPLIFICHSLGGLVFKQAYLKALDSDEHMFLAKRISGVFFFGTPHKGSSLASWSTMTARLLKTASLGANTNTQLSKDLEPNSKRMANISEAFLKRCSSLKIISCYETLKMDYLNTLVVEKDMAVLGHSSEKAIAIESDHRGMCRFGTITEKRFSAIKFRLGRLADDAQKAIFLESDNLMTALNSSNYSSHRARNPAPVEGTCTWRSTSGSGARRQSYEMMRLRAEDETESISDDVSRVVAAKIEDLIDRGLPIGLLKSLQAELVKRADRTFLWVSLVLSLLEEKVESGASRRDLDGILNTRDIFSVYSELLASRPEPMKARKMLNIILAAARPLTIEEVSIALAVAPYGDDSGNGSPERHLGRRAKLTFDDVEYGLVYPLENHLKHVCGHFIRIIKKKVYLVHETAREFLLAPKTSAAQRKRGTNPLLDPPHESQLHHFQHTFSLVNANTLLLDICVAFLYCLAKPSKTSPPGEVSPETEPFLSYAAVSWTIHYHRTKRLLDQRENRYYQNLCHPLFPGFDCWMQEFWDPNHTMAKNQVSHPPGAPDDIQDYYIEYFNLETHSSSSHGAGLDDKHDSAISDFESCEDEQSDASETSLNYGGVAFGHDKVDDQRDRLHLPLWRGADTALSSNPGSLSNHYFPLKVDGEGLVSLDFKDRSSHKPSES